MSRTFDYFFTGTGIIRRDGVIIAGGKRGTQGATNTVIRCSAMTSVTDDEVRRQVKTPVLNTPMEIKQVFAGSSGHVEVRKGDSFVLGSRIFPIRSVERWPMIDPHEELIRLVVEVMDK